MEALGIEVHATPVPLSRRHARCTLLVHQRLRWFVTLTLRGRDVLAAEYAASVHAPFVRRPPGTSVDHELRDFELECGLHAHRGASGEIVAGEAIRPDPAAVVADILLAVDAVEAYSFEDWARRLGIGAVADWRDEVLYRRDLEAGSELRSALGESGLADLRYAARGVLSLAQRSLGHAIHRVGVRADLGAAPELDAVDDDEIEPPPLTEVFVLSCVLEVGIDALGTRWRDHRWEVAIAGGCDYDRLARLSRLLRTSRIWVHADVELASDGETTAATDGLTLTIQEGGDQCSVK